MKIETDVDASSPEDGDNSINGKEDTVAAIDRCLKRPWRTKRKIARFFRRFAIDESKTGAKALSIQQASNMLEDLSEELGVPASLFCNMHELYERFDFDGDGLLEKYEVGKLFKYVLRQRRTELGGRVQEISVPYLSLAGEGFTVTRELGRGGQGVMYLCSKKMSAKQYCVKFYGKASANACGLNEMIDEYALMKELANEHIARTYEVFQDSEFYYLVNEPYFGGDLTQLSKRANDEGLRMSEAWWRPIFRQCLDGLAYLHRKAIMHCDIKEPNIMIASDTSYAAPVPVLIDFGLSTTFSKVDQGACGTPGYIPPETWATGQWYPVGDMFSMGITFFQLMVGRVPSSRGSQLGVLQPSFDYDALMNAGLAAQLPWQTFPSKMDKLRDLVALMTHREKEHRLRAPLALSHSWFSSSSDALLPESTLAGLLGSSAGHRATELAVNDLVADNNLDELRNMRDNVESSSHGLTGLKKVGKRFTALLKARGMDQDSVDARTWYIRVLDEAIWAKKNYSHHYIKDLFAELDVDGSGNLSIEELEKLLNSDAFECPYDDIKDLVAQVGVDDDGTISFERFKQAILEDGRIARRSDVEGARVQCCLM